MARTSRSVKVRNKPPIAEVVWYDAHSTNSGENYTIDKAIEEEAVCRYTCGYLLIKNKEKVVLASTWDHWEGDTEATVTELTIIPSNWIVDVTVIRKERLIRMNKKTALEE
jgi:hypothetical protein